MKHLLSQRMIVKQRVVLPVLFSLTALSVLLFSGPAQAHKVYVFAWVEAGVIHTESSFGDKKVSQGQIIVTDLSGHQLITGETDDQGNFSFPVPDGPTSDLTIKLIAGMGHQAQWTVPLQELRDTGTAETLEKAMEKKAALAKKPPAENILAGLAVIFGIAFTASIFVKLRRKKRKHD